MGRHIEIMRLKHDLGLPHRTISQSLNISIGSVHNVLQRARQMDIGWPLPPDIDEHRLYELLYPTPYVERCGIAVDHQYISTEVRKKGVTLQLLWSEYKDKGYTCSYSQYCRDHKAWRERNRISMRQVHEPGDTVFADFSGLSATVAQRTAQIFVAALGASQYMFAYAVWTQNLEDWLLCNTRMLEFFKGCPNKIMIDNLKSAVSKACRYDPDVNPTYQRWAEHYSVCVIPARPFKPKDKAIAEGAVKIVQTKILAPLRDTHFDSLAELNTCMRDKLVTVNDTAFQKRPNSRSEEFHNIDYPALHPLPLIPYQYVDSKVAKVGHDYHVLYSGTWYSVPYQYINKDLKIESCTRFVRIYYGDLLVATHIKSNTSKQVTDLEHMPESHRQIGKWTPQRLRDWAQFIGDDCYIWINARIEQATHFQQVSRLCIGVLSLSKTHSYAKVNMACRIANEQHIERLKPIKEILKHQCNLDADNDKQLTLDLPQQHENVRGAKHFK